VLGAAQPWIGVWLWLFVVVQPTFVAVHKFESQVPLLFSAAAFVEAENVIMSGSDGARRIEVISPLGVGPLSRAAPVSVANPSGPERQRRYERSDEAKPKSGIGSSLSGIRSLPLGAKIAATLIVVWLAWLVMGRGLAILVERRRKMIEGLSYFVIGAALWFGSGVFWLG
jgi:hypothetical protein